MIKNLQNVLIDSTIYNRDRNSHGYHDSVVPHRVTDIDNK